MNLKLFVSSMIVIWICTGCIETKDSETSSSATSANCKGTYTVKDSNGLIRQRFNEYSTQLGCLTDPVPLTHWEASLNKRFDTKVTCTPQTDLPSMYLKSNGNYYSYRNSKIFIELDSTTGQARRLIIGEMPDGSLSFNRQVFCYYLRTDVETEPTNPFNYGALLHFDLELSASSNSFSPQELYNYRLIGNDLLLQKLDDNTGVDWTWCPTNTPIGFCDYLRNGNDFYFPPDPNLALQNQLRSESILIRSELTLTKILAQEFNSAWDSTTTSAIEVDTSRYIEKGGKWKYMVNANWDEPFFIGRAIRNYMRRDPMQPFMPDLNWAMTFQFPYVCYQARKEVTFTDGSKGSVLGEACYDSNGQYHFTQY